MSRDERRIYQLGVAFAAVMIIAMTSVLTEECGKNTVYAAAEVVDGNFIDGTATSPEKGQIREDSGMPCVNREQFERWYETYEPTASEEEILPDIGTVHDESEAELLENSRPYAEEIQSEDEMGSSESVLDLSTAEKQVVYSVNGETLNPELQALLYDALDRHGISYWFEIACCQCYQESRFNIYAVNQSNHEDMGILQYKSRYWDWNRGDIFDPAAQIELYAEQMAARLNAGLSADECISRHKTSDYSTAVDWTYVQQVKQHIPSLEAIR